MPQVQGPRNVGQVVFERAHAERLRRLVDAWIEVDKDWRKLSDWRRVSLPREDKELLGDHLRKSMTAGFFFSALWPMMRTGVSGRPVQTAGSISYKRHGASRNIVLPAGEANQVRE